MRAYAPSARSTRILAKSAVGAFKKLSLRDAFGHILRSLTTVIGIGLVFSLGIGFVLSMNSYIAGINDRFDSNEKWDVRLLFDGPQNSSVLSEVRDLPGVEAAEPHFGSVAEISSGQEDIDVQYNVLQKDSKMTALPLTSGSTDNQGVIISGDVAYRLDAEVGDEVTLSTRESKDTLPISGIFNELGSSEVYRLSDVPSPNGALLKIDSNDKNRLEDSFSRLGFVKSWAYEDSFKDGWLTLFQEYQGMIVAMDFISVILVILVIGILVYLSANERRWEFVTLKLIGFSNASIIRSAVLEYFFLALVGASLGIPIGIKLADLFAGTFESLISPPPTVISWEPVILRILLILAVAVVTTWVVVALNLRRGVADKIRRLFGAA